MARLYECLQEFLIFRENLFFDVALFLSKQKNGTNAHWAEMGKVMFWKFWLLISILVVKLAMEGYGKILRSKALFSKLNWLHIVPMLSYDFVTFTT